MHQAGDSHTVALTERGAVYGWGTFRDGSGVMGFSDADRIQLVPALLYQPTTAGAQVVKVVSGPHTVSRQLQAFVRTLIGYQKFNGEGMDWGDVPRGAHPCLMLANTYPQVPNA